MTIQRKDKVTRCPFCTSSPPTSYVLCNCPIQSTKQNKDAPDLQRDAVILDLLIDWLSSDFGFDALDAVEEHRPECRVLNGESRMKDICQREGERGEGRREHHRSTDNERER